MTLTDYPLVSVVIPTHNRKEKLARLIESILNSNYPKDRLEIIVVDDASTDGTYEYIKRKFPEVKIIRNQEEKLVAESRNIGIKAARGRYIFLIDDDNVVDKDAIKELVEFMEKHPNVGVAGPIMYFLKDPDRIWCAGVQRNMWTSFTKFIGRNARDTGLIDRPILSDDFPNAFMVRREVIEKVGLFNSTLFPIHFEESDFCQRVKHAGYKVVMLPRAKVWHDVPPPEEVDDKLRLLHIHNELRAFYAGRNRIIFAKKYSKPYQFLAFILFFNWLITAYYLKAILLSSKRPFKDRLKIAKAYLRGIREGLRWAFR